jgi:hypothetical protein
MHGACQAKLPAQPDFLSLRHASLLGVSEEGLASGREAAVPRYRTNTRTEGQRGGEVSGTDWTNLGEFEFGF